jgi:hypothetical protein
MSFIGMARTCRNPPILGIVPAKPSCHVDALVFADTLAATYKSLGCNSAVYPKRASLLLIVSLESAEVALDLRCNDVKMGAETQTKVGARAETEAKAKATTQLLVLPRVASRHRLVATQEQAALVLAQSPRRIPL